MSDAPGLCPNHGVGSVNPKSLRLKLVEPLQEPMQRRDIPHHVNGQLCNVQQMQKAMLDLVDVLGDIGIVLRVLRGVKGDTCQRVSNDLAGVCPLVIRVP